MHGEERIVGGEFVQVRDTLAVGDGPSILCHHAQNRVRRRPTRWCWCARAQEGGSALWSAAGRIATSLSVGMIIPGASPSHRVVPGEDATSHAYHTHAPASTYVDGYANGFGQGYGAANAGLTSGVLVLGKLVTEGINLGLQICDLLDRLDD